MFIDNYEFFNEYEAMEKALKVGLRKNDGGIAWICGVVVAKDKEKYDYFWKIVVSKEKPEPIKIGRDKTQWMPFSTCGFDESIVALYKTG